jgi:hypothetical protein
MKIIHNTFIDGIDLIAELKALVKRRLQKHS